MNLAMQACKVRSGLSPDVILACRGASEAWWFWATVWRDILPGACLQDAGQNRRGREDLPSAGQYPCAIRRQWRWYRNCQRQQKFAQTIWAEMTASGSLSAN